MVESQFFADGFEGGVVRLPLFFIVIDFFGECFVAGGMEHFDVVRGDFVAAVSGVGAAQPVERVFGFALAVEQPAVAVLNGGRVGVEFDGCFYELCRFFFRRRPGLAAGSRRR